MGTVKKIGMELFDIASEYLDFERNKIDIDTWWEEAPEAWWGFAEAPFMVVVTMAQILSMQDAACNVGVAWAGCSDKIATAKRVFSVPEFEGLSMVLSLYQLHLILDKQFKAGFNV